MALPPSRDGVASAVQDTLSVPPPVSSSLVNYLAIVAPPGPSTVSFHSYPLEYIYSGGAVTSIEIIRQDGHKTLTNAPRWCCVPYGRLGGQLAPMELTDGVVGDAAIQVCHTIVVEVIAIYLHQ